MKNNLTKDLANIYDKGQFFTESEQCWAYGYDNSMQHALPDAVVIPQTERQIAETIKLCNEKSIPFIVRGRGTNTTGAVVPIHGGIVCVMENFSKVIEFDAADRYIVVQPGISNSEVQNFVAKHGFFWAPDPTSSTYCTVGGNIACNAGGPRAIKYGTCRENTLGLRAVTGFGEVIQTGVYTTKGAVGYDFTRLLVGSEGTLGVVTEAILKLTPLPETKMTLQAYYKDIVTATNAIANVMRQPTSPCVLEFIDRNCLDIIRQSDTVNIPREANAMILLEVDGASNQISQLAEQVKAASINDGLVEILIAKTQQEIDALWATRKALSPAMRQIAPKKINEDVVVPVSKIPTLIQTLDELAKKYGIKIVNFGHAGNGNIHVNLLINPDNPQESAAAEKCLDEVFQLVLDLKGTLSGEHGIGLVKREFVDREIDPVSLKLMHAVKKQFDPNGILNPGKAF